MKKISIIIPMYHEEDVAEECYNRISKILKNMNQYEYEIICVNDGSKDKTQDILEKIAQNDNNLKIISFSRNFGHQCAVTAGLKYVTGDCAIIIDADMQDPPEIIPHMIELWENGNEVIYGKRKKRKGESLFKRSTAKLFYRILNLLSDIEIPKDTGEFRLVDRKVIDIFNNLPEHNKYLRGLWGWIGFKQIPIEYEREKRYAGKTKYPLRKMLKLASDGIIGFSTKPLKIVGAIRNIINLYFNNNTNIFYNIIFIWTKSFNSRMDIYNGNSNAI